jgi:hypothetical protein
VTSAGLVPRAHRTPPGSRVISRPRPWSGAGDLGCNS